HRQILDIVKHFEDVRVRSLPFAVEKSQCAEECGSQKFASAFLAVEVNIKQVAGIELCFVPRAAVRNNQERVKHLTIGMLRRFKGQTRRAMQLADDDAFGA